MIIAIDFDGTLVEHEYPNIGPEVPLAFEALRLWQSNGHKLILLTMRSGQELINAVEYCKNKGINFWSVNDNPEQKGWTDSRKVFAHIYIDDANMGCPLMQTKGLNTRQVVDWKQILKDPRIK